MTTGAVRRSLPWTLRLQLWLARRRKRPDPGDPGDYWPLHMHARPRVVVTTDKGIHHAFPVSLCLFDDSISFGFVFIPDEDSVIGAVEFRWGDQAEQKIVPPETLEAPAGRPFKFLLTIGIVGSAEIGPVMDDDDSTAAPA